MNVALRLSALAAGVLASVVAGAYALTHLARGVYRAWRRT